MNVSIPHKAELIFIESRQFLNDSAYKNMIKFETAKSTIHSYYSAISTNQKPTIYRNLYENTDPGAKYNIQTLVIVSRHRDLQLQVSEITWIYISVND